MEDGLVRFLEGRAHALRLPYTHATPPGQLLEAVLHAEHQNVAERGPQAMPACFGRWFAGPYDKDCDQCQVQSACMARLAWDILPEHVAQVGTTPAALAEELGLDAKAIVLTQTFAAQAKGQDDAVFAGYKRLAPPPRPKVRSMADIPRPFGLLAYAALLGARARLPVWQRDVTTLDAHGTTKLLGLTRVAFYKPPKKSPAWAARHSRERNRNALYKQLRTGMLLRRVYRGVLHEVRVGYKCYTYEGQTYPTLYAVVQAIAGSCTCPKQYGPGDVRPEGVRHTAQESPTRFFSRCFQELVHKMPPKRKRSKKKAV